MKPQDFINLLQVAATHSALITKIPAGFTIADAALESAWGSSRLFTEAKNIFGVKADPAWKGPTYILQTREYLKKQWVMVPAKWRMYDTLTLCLTDHANFLISNKRYDACFKETTSEGFARAVAAAGYATDPTYADKIISIVRQYKLDQFDLLP